LAMNCEPNRCGSVSVRDRNIQNYQIIIAVRVWNGFCEKVGLSYEQPWPPLCSVPNPTKQVVLTEPRCDLSHIPSLRTQSSLNHFPIPSLLAFSYSLAAIAMSPRASPMFMNIVRSVSVSRPAFWPSTICPRSA
jgi:hypothetical protein